MYSCQQVREMIHQTPLRVSVHSISLRVGVSEGDSSSHHPEGMLVHVALAKVGRELLCLCFQEHLVLHSVGFSGHLELYTVALGVCIDAFMLFLW